MEESLNLLESIADAGAHPENFADLCYDWAQRPRDPETLDGFEGLLNIIYKQSNHHLITRNPTYFSDDAGLSDYLSESSFIIDSDHEILSIGDNIAKTLGVTIGDSSIDLFNIDLSDVIETAKNNPHQKSICEIFARDGTRHIAFFAKVMIKDRETDFFRLTLSKIKLPKAADDYIRKNFKLTNAEIEVLGLTLQRFTIEKISKIRGSSENTVRTHIRNIKRKFKSRTLTDVISSAHEIISLPEHQGDTNLESNQRYIPINRNTMLMKIPGTPYEIEYSRFGRSEDKPLILLHSIEYGISPPKEFIIKAVNEGYCLYIPLRSGFGRTSPASSIRQSATILNEFIRALRLTNVTLICFSTSAPTGIKLLEMSNSIEHTVFVNYGFNTKNKIQHIQPVWLRGLLELGLGSEQSFIFTWRMTISMLGLLGYKKFYKKMYKNCDEDLAFLKHNSESFKSSGNLLLSASAKACRNDLMAAFIHNTIVHKSMLDRSSIISIFGSHTHGISLEPIRAATESLGIPFHVLSKTGRNCVYQESDAFFHILAQKQMLKKAI